MSKDEPITVLTLTGSDAKPRKFCIRKMDDTIDALYDRVEIPTICGLIIKLCGDTNECFKHGCPKMTDGEPRISMSFRRYE